MDVIRSRDWAWSGLVEAMEHVEHDIMMTEHGGTSTLVGADAFAESGGLPEELPRGLREATSLPPPHHRSSC